MITASYKTFAPKIKLQFSILHFENRHLANKFFFGVEHYQIADARRGGVAHEAMCVCVCLCVSLRESPLFFICVLSVYVCNCLRVGVCVCVGV